MDDTRIKIAALIVVLAFAGVIAGVAVSRDSDEPTLPEVTAIASPSEVPEKAALPPLFQEAETCFSRCAAKFLTYQQRARFPLPYKFAKLLETARFRSSFERLIAGLPAEYAGLAERSVDDFDELEFGGTTNLSMTTADGRQIQIYFDVGYPERHGENADTARRPPGILTIAVDVARGEMAGIFNGPQDLSDYRFGGSEGLLASLLAYEVADQVHSEKVRKLGFPDNGPKLTFPLVGDDLAAARDRLGYLAAHFQNGQIVDTQTLEDIGEVADDAAGLNWYTYNSSRTSCFKTGGPSEKLDEFVGYIDQPTTNDFQDESGNLTKVEVVNDQGDGNEVVWTYYRHRADCERDWVTRNADLADRYR